MAYLGIEVLPFRREMAAAIGPLDKAHAKEFFEFLHLGAEGRLGDIGCLGSSRKVSVLTVNDKVPQLLYRWQFHVTPPLKKGLRIRASCRGASPCVILTAIRNEETVPRPTPGQYLLNHYSAKSSSNAALAASNSSSVGAT